MGFFFVDRTTLTAMLSTTVTYLIVLLQDPSNSRGDAGKNTNFSTST